MRNLIIFIIYLIAIPTIGQNCKVLLPKIAEKYEGDCKKGKAHGQGKAWGKKDNYEGSFKKGKPHGQGIYKWGNGNVYQGEFEKGLMNGEGSLFIKKTNETQKGYFKKGNYIGLYKYPYKTISQSSIRRIIFIEKQTKNDEVSIAIFSNGSRIYPEILVNDLNNSMQENKNGLVLTNINYPLKSVALTFTVDNLTYRTTFAIYKKSDWEVQIYL